MAQGYLQSPFERLADRERVKIETLFQRRKVKKGEIVASHEKDEIGLYWIAGGLFKLYRLSQQGNYELGTPIYGGLVGAIGVTFKQERIHIEAARNGEILLLKGDALQAAGEIPGFLPLVQEYAAEDFSNILVMADALRLANVEYRLLAVIHMLVTHAVRFNGTGDPAQPIEWPFKHEEIADQLRISRPYLSSMLSSLRRKGILVIRNGRLQLSLPDGDPARDWVLPGGKDLAGF